MTSPARAGAAATGAVGPDRTAALLDRLATVEAGIHADRHRQPAAVVEEIARLWAAGDTVAGIAARTGVSREIVRDRLRRAGALEYRFREQRRHVQEVFERQGARLIAAYEGGATVAALAVEAGVSRPTLSKFLVDRGVPLRHDHGWYRRRQHNGG